MAEYVKTKEEVDPSKLKDEIDASSISKTCMGVRYDAPDTLKVYFDEAISTEEETTLDGIISAHSIPTHTVVIQQTQIKETALTGGRYRSKGFSWDIPSGVGWKDLGNTSIPFDIDIVSCGVWNIDGVEGDKLEVRIAPATIIGTVAGAHSAEAVEVTVAAEATLDALDIGYIVQFGDANEYWVTSKDRANKKIGIARRDGGSPAGLVAGISDEAYVTMTVIMVDEVYLKPGHVHESGATKMGGSGLPTPTPVKMLYYNSDGAADKKLRMNVDLLYGAAT